MMNLMIFSTGSHTFVADVLEEADDKSLFIKDPLEIVSKEDGNMKFQLPIWRRSSDRAVFHVKDNYLIKADPTKEIADAYIRIVNEMLNPSTRAKEEDKSESEE